MRLRVFHRTRYVYRAPVTDNYNELRLRPATADERRLEFFLLNVQPPVRMRHFRDEHLNYVHWFEIDEPHQELDVEATSHVVTTSQTASGLPLGFTFAGLEEFRDESLHPFLGDSRYITVDPVIWRLAVDVRDERTDVFETVGAIMGFIHSHWEYAPAVTTASTHMSAAFLGKRGVCQDFAHIMIGLCRALRIPARYVSGYLYNGPLTQLRGTQASHAWCEVHLPERGWFGFDPTNNTLVDDRYIKVATGRDYDDAAPVRGHFSGPPGATAALEVTVEVEER